MGLYDRGYYHDEDDVERPYAQGAGIADTMVAKLIILTVALWIVDALTARNPVLQPWLCLQGDTLLHPLQYYRLITAGFVHNPEFPSHIVFTMLGLFFFGSSVELRVGSSEFLRLYLAANVLSNLVWCVVALAMGAPGGDSSYGSDGAVAAVAIALAVMDPQRTIMLMFVIPAPLWLAATLYVVITMSGAMRGSVGAASQLAGAAFGYVYVVGQWNLTRWLPTPGWVSRLGKPSRRRSDADLKVYTPADDQDEDVEKALEAEVDRILRKINRDGEASLTKTERATLERASRKYRKR